MLSDVPQGSQNGPLLHILPMIQICAKIIVTDCQLCQKDLDGICLWSEVSHFKPNAEKCWLNHTAVKELGDKLTAF